MGSLGRFVGLLLAAFLIFVGTVLLLGNLGLIAAEPVELIVDFWPLLLIAIGLYVIWVRLAPVPAAAETTLSEPLLGASKGQVAIDFGAGDLNISPLKGGDELVRGTFRFRAEKAVKRSGGSVEVRLRRGEWSPFGRGYADDWRVGLTTAIPLTVRLNTGACRVRADLSDNKVEVLDLSTGASDVTLKLPASSGLTRVLVKGGATDVKIIVPRDVAARITSKVALGAVRVDEERFPRTDGGFESKDFESAPNKADIEVSAGAASVTVS